MLYLIAVQTQNGFPAGVFNVDLWFTWLKRSCTVNDKAGKLTEP